MLKIFRVLHAASLACAGACPLSGIQGEIGRASRAGVAHRTLGSSKVHPQGLETRTISFTPAARPSRSGKTGLRVELRDYIREKMPAT